MQAQAKRVPIREIRAIRGQKKEIRVIRVICVRQTNAAMQAVIVNVIVNV